MRVVALHSVCRILPLAVAAVLSATSPGAAYDTDNEFIPAAFPGKTVTRAFSIPLDGDELAVVYPACMESRVDEFRAALARKCGESIPFIRADRAAESDLAHRHLVVVGNIMN
ncbi:MAG: hypothetical protein J7M24_06080, partial [Candidatus Latescibacteria bacterium]|nr:hypothetical protein [Candidatus Latescibacterota bacterium]